MIRMAMNTRDEILGAKEIPYLPDDLISQFLYVYSIDREVKSLTLPSLPVISFSLRSATVSFCGDSHSNKFHCYLSHSFCLRLSLRFLFVLLLSSFLPFF